MTNSTSLVGYRGRWVSCFDAPPPPPTPEDSAMPPAAIREIR
jgi:hypothetical protein